MNEISTHLHEERAEIPIYLCRAALVDARREAGEVSTREETLRTLYTLHTTSLPAPTPSMP